MQNGSVQERLIAAITPLLAPLGYELVHAEVLTGRQKILRLFIDRPASRVNEGGIGIEDCARVSRALDESLDQLTEIDQIFGGGSYELEVSSPGIDRPLRKVQDYERFAGREARIHVYRPLSAEELENVDYQQKNPRQKNFVGVLRGVRQQKVLLALSAKRKRDESMVHQVTIPLSLISKANLEPRLDIIEEKEREQA